MTESLAAAALGCSSDPFIQTQEALIASAGSALGGMMAFSLRRGGCSDPPWDSLNFSALEGDLSNNVARNMETLGRHLGLDPNQIAFCRQVHGDSVAILDRVPEDPPVADALISLNPEVFVGIKTADCLPILLLDPVRRIAAGIHAGWKGTVLRIAGKVVRLLVEDLGVRATDLYVALGPAIGPCCYEVDDNVILPFMKSYPDGDRFVNGQARFSPVGAPEQQRKTLDIVKANLAGLRAAGISEQQIFSTGLCTSCRGDLFFSHRRDKGLTGRHVAVAGFY